MKTTNHRIIEAKAKDDMTNKRIPDQAKWKRNDDVEKKNRQLTGKQQNNAQRALSVCLGTAGASTSQLSKLRLKRKDLFQHRSSIIINSIFDHHHHRSSSSCEEGRNWKME